jgi:tryptophan synthase alpha chain
MLATLKLNDAPPPIFGFGISRPDHVRSALAAGAAGVISGSAIVSLIAADPNNAAPALRDFVASMKAGTELERD